MPVLDRMGRILAWTAAAIGLATEAALVWFFDRLPAWAQLAIWIPIGAAVLLGFALLIRGRRRAVSSPSRRPRR